ncbi:MAG: hypothetical protein OZSIB_2366 [Candidatus Ozemobacter sibiricus]|uniref:Uncharacterized protein n=1 Tax=Candidatus Ozemobacter sibiricus TaxID=2268124 RepID=A0A367ZTF5_9BACT|nr:MAG: hypothetical protein OZSIB_2366 [Candidatus Ozemobacter sibiricus]
MAVSVVMEERKIYIHQEGKAVYMADQIFFLPVKSTFEVSTAQVPRSDPEPSSAEASSSEELASLSDETLEKDLRAGGINFARASEEQRQLWRRRTYYINPGGRVYHLGSCTPGLSYLPVTWKEVTARALAPCERCTGW